MALNSAWVYGCLGLQLFRRGDFHDLPEVSRNAVGNVFHYVEAKAMNR